MSPSHESQERDLIVPDTQPVALAGGRIGSLDFIRGIAVMGILAANIHAFGQPMLASIYPAAFAVDHSPSEDWMWAAQLVLIDGKMRGLFALLFGAGLYLFIEKAWASGASRVLQIKRLGWLAVFGLIHFYFIWQGDILFAYAASGLVLTLVFLDLSARSQLVLGVLGMIAGAILYMTSLGFMQSVVDAGEPDNEALAGVYTAFVEVADEEIADNLAELEIKQDGTYGEYVGHMFEVHGGDPFWGVLDLPFEIMPFMLLGMALYRMGLFEGRFNRRKQVLWGWVMLLAGGALTAIIAVMTLQNGLTYYATLAAKAGWTVLPRAAMVVGLAFLLSAYATREGGWLHARVSAAGRAAFTNYLGTSIVLLPVFSPWGLDLFGVLGRTELYMVVLAAWVVMLLWSKPWLDRFRYGPLEWLWRCLTYGKVFAITR